MSDQADGFLSPFLRQKRFEAVKPHVRGSVLDFGCGIGRFRNFAKIEDYVGVDSDIASIEIARRENPTATFISPAELGQLTRTFDTIVMIALIEHLPAPATVLKDLARHLAPGGQIILTTPQPHLDWFHGIGSHIGLFSKEAHDEHQSLMDKKGIAETAQQAGLTMKHYGTFLFGANQVAVLS